ncbi:MAG: hypothetical protein D6699_02245 [Aquificota bacterium]|nr:MAG: hypothetical protein D6699_02245 [Aquificota bacterium]
MVYIALRLGLLVGIVLLLVGAFLGWEYYRNKKLQEESYREYEIRKLLSAGNYQKALENIKTFPDGPFKPLALSYELYIAQVGGQKVEESKVLEKILKDLKDPELVALYKERYAFALFKEGKNKEALKVLEQIREEDFNYYSALLLKAQILEKEGKKEEALNIYRLVAEKQKDKYLGNLARSFLLEGGT